MCPSNLPAFCSVEEGGIDYKNVSEIPLSLLETPISNHAKCMSKDDLSGEIVYILSFIQIK